MIIRKEKSDDEIFSNLNSIVLSWWMQRTAELFAAEINCLVWE